MRRYGNLAVGSVFDFFQPENRDFGFVFWFSKKIMEVNNSLFGMKK